MTGRSSAGMGVICATFYVWHRRECHPQGKRQSPHGRLNVPKTLASHQSSRTYSQFEEYRAGASILAHELGKARCGHGTFRSRAPRISIAFEVSVFHKLAVPKRDLKAKLSLLTRSRRFLIFTIIRGSSSQ